MPLYAYSCPECGEVQRNFRTIRNRNAGPMCERGHEKALMVKMIEAPAVRGDYPPYDCPVTGKLISGKAEHEANLRKHGARVLEPGESRRAMAAAKKAEADFDRRVGATLDEEITKLPSASREQLAREVSSGADVNVTRATGKAP